MPAGPTGCWWYGTNCQTTCNFQALPSLAQARQDPERGDRKAVIYIRQSTPQEVRSHQESLRLQYALHQRAQALGWRDADIEVIDSDLGRSGAPMAQREG